MERLLTRSRPPKRKNQRTIKPPRTMAANSCYAHPIRPLSSQDTLLSTTTLHLYWWFVASRPIHTYIYTHLYRESCNHDDDDICSTGRAILPRASFVGMDRFLLGVSSPVGVDVSKWENEDNINIIFLVTIVIVDRSRRWRHPGC